MKAITFAILSLQTAVSCGMARARGEPCPAWGYAIVELIGLAEYAACIYCVWNGL